MRDQAGSDLHEIFSKLSISFDGRYLPGIFWLGGVSDPLGIVYDFDAAIDSVFHKPFKSKRLLSHRVGL